MFREALAIQAAQIPTRRRVSLQGVGDVIQACHWLYYSVCVMRPVTLGRDYGKDDRQMARRPSFLDKLQPV